MAEMTGRRLLSARQYSNEDTAGLMHGNFLRFLQRALN